MDIHTRVRDVALELVSGVSQQNNRGGVMDNFAIRGFFSLFHLIVVFILHVRDFVIILDNLSITDISRLPA